MKITTSIGTYSVDETELCDSSLGSLDIQNDIGGLYSTDENFIDLLNRASVLVDKLHPDGYTYGDWDAACSLAVESSPFGTE